MGSSPFGNTFGNTSCPCLGAFPAWHTQGCGGVPASPTPPTPCPHGAGVLCDPKSSPASPDADASRTEPPEPRADLRVRAGLCPWGRGGPGGGSSAWNLSVPSQRQTWVFRSKELMLKSGSAVPEGSLVYVREGSSAFLRTPRGWSRLLVGCRRGGGQGGGGRFQPWQAAPGWIWLLGKERGGSPIICPPHGAAGGLGVALCR